jgi:hypothetical protein
MSRLPLLLRLALHALLFGLLGTWAVRPESPSDLFRVLVPALFALPALPLAVPACRARWSAALGRRLRVLDFLAFNGVCLALLLEGGLRAAALLNDSPLLEPPDASAQAHIATWRGRPGSLRHGFPLNARGLHDVEVLVQRTPGVRRIVALADSFGFGLVPYADNVLTRLDELLDAGGETELVNYGIPSIGPAEYLHLYRTEVRPLQPDLVLICLYVGNDIRSPRGASLLHRDSLLVFSVLDRLLALRGLPRAAAGGRPGIPVHDDATFLELEAGQLDVCERALSRGAAQAYADTERILDELARTVGERLRVVLIPDAYQVDDALWTRLVGGREAAYEREAPQRRLAAFFAERGVPCLDLLPALRRAQADGPTYAHNDTHWNARGNHVAAQAIADWPALPRD